MSGGNNRIHFRFGSFFFSFFLNFQSRDCPDALGAPSIGGVSCECIFLRPFSGEPWDAAAQRSAAQSSRARNAQTREAATHERREGFLNIQPVRLRHVLRTLGLGPFCGSPVSQEYLDEESAERAAPLGGAQPRDGRPAGRARTATHGVGLGGHGSAGACHDGEDPSCGCGIAGSGCQGAVQAEHHRSGRTSCAADTSGCECQKRFPACECQRLAPIHRVQHCSVDVSSCARVKVLLFSSGLSSRWRLRQTGQTGFWTKGHRGGT